MFKCILIIYSSFFFFFFNDTATTEIYTLSLHDALPIFTRRRPEAFTWQSGGQLIAKFTGDRKSTRLNSSHVEISYAVFCLKKKKKKINALCKTKQQKSNVQKAYHSITILSFVS